MTTSKSAGYAVYDTRWQARRIDLVGMWNDFDIEDALKICDDYINSDETNLRSRLWRVINCMNAVMMGWNKPGSVEQVTKAKLISARSMYQRMIKTRIELGEKLEWRIAPSELGDDHLKRIYMSLRSRWNGAPQIKNRPELYEVLCSMEAEMTKRGFKVLDKEVPK